MNRRSFLRSVAAAVAAMFAKVGVVGAAEAAPEEREPEDEQHCPSWCSQAGVGCDYCSVPPQNRKYAGGLSWERRKDTIELLDPIDQLLRDMAVAARHTFERQIGLEGERNE